MEKPLNQTESNTELSRRDFSREQSKTLAYTALFAIGIKLHKGIRLRQPPIGVETRTVGREIEPIQLHAEVKSEVDLEPVTITQDGKMFVEPDGAYFTINWEHEYVHRVNTKERIDEAIEMGGNLLDFDANVTVRGNNIDDVMVEHGKIPQFSLSLPGGYNVNVVIPVVLDQNEMGIQLGIPESSFEDIIAYLSERNKEDNVLRAVSIELKRGDYEPKILNEMIQVLIKYGVPAVVYPVDPLRLVANNGIVTWL